MSYIDILANKHVCLLHFFYWSHATKDAEVLFELSQTGVQVPNLFFADHCVSKTWPPPVLIGYNGQNIVNIKSTINSLLLRALVYFFFSRLVKIVPSVNWILIIYHPIVL